jgi:hypothetical protein
MPVTLDLSNLRDNLAPLFHRYPRQTTPQGAFVELDEGGTVSASWNGEVGNGVPVSVWHGRTLRWSVPSAVSGQALAGYLEGEGLALLERVHLGHASMWDGSNLVGCLSEDAQAASRELGQDLQEVATADVQRVDDWLGSLPWCDVWPGTDALAHCVEDWKRLARQDGTTLDGDLEDYLLGRARARSERGESLTAKQREALGVLDCR